MSCFPINVLKAWFQKNARFSFLVSYVELRYHQCPLKIFLKTFVREIKISIVFNFWTRIFLQKLLQQKGLATWQRRTTCYVTLGKSREFSSIMINIIDWYLLIIECKGMALRHDCCKLCQYQHDLTLL